MENSIIQAMEEKDYARAIRLMEEVHTASRIMRQRSMIKTFQQNSQPERKEKSYDYLWLTVNPSPDCSFDTFMQIVGRMVQKKWLKSYVYVYEQRGVNQDELGKGFHIHAIIKKPEDKSPAHCIRELSSTFKKCCDVSNYHLFNTKWIDQEEYNRKLGYILGQKESTPENNKVMKQEMDKQWRLVRSLQPYYYLNIDIGQYE